MWGGLDMKPVATESNMIDQRERLFFFVMALALALTVVIGFALFFKAGFSSFGSPWWVHLHAITFMGWIGFFILQTGVIWRGNVELHRKLGRFGAGYAAWMVVLALVVTPMTLSAGRAPPFFTPSYFLAMDLINIILFAVLMCFAITLRKQTDWHRRIMLCATLCVIAPAWGRLIVLSGLPMTAWLNIVPLLGYMAVAAIADLFLCARLHPAYLWGAGSLVVFAAATGLLAQLPPFVSLANQIAG
jgi:hypothetical protein